MAQTKLKPISADGFTPNMEESTVGRIASFLNHAAKEYPKQYAPYNMIAKAMLGCSRMPRLDSDEAGLVRRTMSRVRRVLREQYQRELDTQVGIGVRATVDSADTLKTALPKKMRRLEQARVNVVQTADIIDKDQLPDTAEMKAWKAWFNKDVGSVLKTLRDPTFEKNLLPPASTTEE